MEKTPTPEQLNFLNMLKSCMENGFIKIKVVAKHNARTNSTDTRTEVYVDLGDDCWEGTIGAYED